ncbi:MAG: type II secretion system F family protein, partial [Candidatus Brocadiaceae bacterium]
MAELPSRRGFPVKLTLGKLIWVADSTATMLEAGLPITRVLDVLVNQASGRARRALQKARAEIDAGATLAEALASSGVFPALFLRLVEVGEESGKLERTTQELQRLYAFQRRLRRGFLGGVAFPALQYVLAIAIMAAVTAVLGSFGIRLGNPALIVALGYGVPAVLVTAYLLAVRWIATARIVHEMTLHLPVVGGVARSVALARFSLVMHLCLEAGMPVTEA